MKVSELEGGLLDFWTGLAAGEKGVYLHNTIDGRKACSVCDESQWSLRSNYSPSSDWSQGGPIIERERIKFKDGMFEKWKADLKVPHHKYSMEGPTALIAAMRAFVASRFGVEVDDS